MESASGSEWAAGSVPAPGTAPGAWARDAGAPFQPDTLLIERYRVLRRLGRGGMGVVYAAQDIRLQRQVALKFLPPEWSRDRGAIQRFVREARTASALDHPNICTVHEIAELESHELFIVMAFYDGEALDRKIRRGNLSREEAVDVAVRVARALDRAHEAGIIHRDIKPANIMITRRGEVKVMDFGLAKLQGQARLSRVGQVMGTVAYMSPEQLQGEGVDHRTDLWSLGVSFYEMLTGRMPFVGDDDRALSQSILKDDPRPADEVPRALRAILQQALEKRPRHRYQSAGHLLDDLEPHRTSAASGHRSSAGRRQLARSLPRSGWLIGAVAAGLLAILAAVVLPRLVASRQVESLVVLPFDNLAGDSADEYFVDGLTESLISELGTIRALRVISHTSAMSFRDTELSLTEIARQLGVDAVVEGVAQKDGERVRVTARLLSGDSEELLWASTYERDLGDLGTLARDVARQIAGAMLTVLTPDEEGRLKVERKVDPRALDLYLRGRHVWHSGALDSMRLARELFEKAIAVDPNYALAHAGLADAFPSAFYLGEMSAEEAFGKARLHARTAIELDDTVAEAYASLMRVALEWDWDWQASERYIRRALELNPNYAVAHHWLAWYFATVGRFEEAIEQLDRAQDLDPLSLRIAANRVRFVYFAGRYEEAITTAEALLDQHPDLLSPRRFHARALLALGHSDEALNEFERMAQNSSSTLVLGDLAHAYALSGREEEAGAMLTDFLAEDPLPIYSIALVHLAAGRSDQALDWLERAFEEHSNPLVRIKCDPRLDPLRAEPRFEALLRRMKLDDRSLAGVAGG